MKKINRIMTVAMVAAALAGLTACGNKTEPPAGGEQRQTEAVITSTVSEFTPIDTQPLDEQMPVETETTTETEPAEDLTVIPDAQDFFNAVYDKLNAVESFEMTCKLKGTVPDGKMINHEFTNTVADNVSHLRSTYQDLNTTDDIVSYEEYQVIDDGIITTITKNGETWVDDTPKEMIRCTMPVKAFNDIPLIGLLSTDSEVAKDTFRNNTISRTEDGGYRLYQSEWSDLTCYSDDFLYHGFAGLIRTPAIEDYLYEGTGSIQRPSGGPEYIFDKDFNLQSISFDIIMRNQNSPFDLHCDITFDKWNDIAKINVPKTTELKPASDDSTDSETSATTAE